MNSNQKECSNISRISIIRNGIKRIEFSKCTSKAMVHLCLEHNLGRYLCLQHYNDWYKQWRSLSVDKDNEDEENLYL